MTFKTIKIAGEDAVAKLNEYRSRFPRRGEYPFLIGDAEELSRIQESADFDDRDPSEIVRASHSVDLDQWIAERRSEAEENGFSESQSLGKWPGEIKEKGAILLHTDIVTGKIKPEVYLGLASIDEPWHLPAVLKWGGWNECPAAEVQCAFHRGWQADFGAEITGVSSDVIECVVARPPSDVEKALDLAWRQYWYCADIVEQGCETINYLGASLMNSLYWYFWWD